MFLLNYCFNYSIMTCESPKIRFLRDSCRWKIIGRSWTPHYTVKFGWLSVFTMDDSDFNLYNWRFRFVEAQIKIRVICAKMDGRIDACNVVGALQYPISVLGTTWWWMIWCPNIIHHHKFYVGQALFRTWGKWEK